MSREQKDSILRGLIWLSSIITVGILFWILTYVIINGVGEINMEFLFTNPNGEEGGIFSCIFSTIFVVVLSVLISTPIGVCAAIYLVEYAKPGKIVRVIRFATESLSGIPSIIFGLFGFIFFVTYLKLGFSLLAGALTVSMMVLPTIVRTTEEALKAVPNTYREGSLGLGATKLRTITKVILPCAIPGILTSVILSIGRIIGETAALLFTAGMYASEVPTSVFDSGRTLTVHLYQLCKEGISFERAFATATILIIIVLILNFTANKLGSKLNKSKA